MREPSAYGGLEWGGEASDRRQVLGAAEAETHEFSPATGRLPEPSD
jgi:hypothetical protein